MVEQLRLFRGGEIVLSGRRMAHGTRQALDAYVAGELKPSFELGALAREQARLDLLRTSRRKLAREQGSRGWSKLRLVEFSASPAGARVERSVRACAKRIKTLEAKLVYAA